MRWSGLWLQFWVFSEANKLKRLTLAQVRRMEASELDYQCLLKAKTTGVEITRDDLAGQRFQVYVPPARNGAARPGIYEKLESLGLTVKLVGDGEKIYLAPLNSISAVAMAVGVRRRAKNPSAAGQLRGFFAQKSQVMGGM